MYNRVGIFGRLEYIQVYYWNVWIVSVNAQEEPRGASGKS